MSVRTDHLNAVVAVKGDAARKELIDLQRQAKKTAQEIKGITDPIEKANKQGALDKMTSRMAELRKQIGLTGLSSKQLNSELARLKQLEGHLVPFTQQWIENRRQLDAVKRRIDEVRTGTTGLSYAWTKVGAAVKQFGTLAVSYLGLTFLSQQIGNVLRRLYDMADSMANVAKTTGMTMKQVEQLNSKLGEINTRTSRKELLDLAADAGKAGYSMEKDVLAFVKAGDMINVALGEDLGDDGIKNIAKINELFGQTKKLGIEDAMLKAGSAINSLGQAGTAAESYLVDFTKRLAGVSVQSGITLPNILGLATTLDELGQQSETSSTAISQLFVKMQVNSEKFATIAGLNVKDFTELLKKDANEAFIQFLEALSKNTDGLADLGRAFDEMGMDGSRSIQVISALAQNTGKLREKQALANTEYDRGNSVLNEFNTKNNNVAGTLDKLTRMFNSWIHSGFIGQTIDGLIQVAGRLAGITQEAHKATDAFMQQRSAVQNLTTNIAPLLSRYDELKGKTNLNADEQAELKEIIKKVSETVPLAATSFDNYGRALDINTGKAKDLIRQQQILMQYQNREAIAEQEAILKNYQSNHQVLMDALKRGYNDVYDMNGVFVKRVFFSSEQVLKLQQNVADLQKKIDDTTSLIESFKGITPAVASAGQAQAEALQQQVAEAESEVQQLTTAEKKEQKERERQEREHQEEILRMEAAYRKQQIDNLQDGEQKERAQLQEWFRQELEQYDIHLNDLWNLSNEKKQLLEQLQIQYAQRSLEIDKQYALKKIQVQSNLSDMITRESDRVQQTEEAKQLLIQNTGDAFVRMLNLMSSNERKSAKSRHAFAVAQKGVSAAEATILGIMAVQKTLADPKLLFPADVITAAAIGIAAAGNVAEILATPIPGYAKGGVTEGGPVTRQLAWFGENGPEYVIPNWMLRDPAIANIAGILEGIRTNGFASGGTTASNPVNNISLNNAELLIELRLMRQEMQRRSAEPQYAIFDFDYYSKTTKKLSRIKDRSGV